jgi:hypothetical protein
MCVATPLPHPPTPPAHTHTHNPPRTHHTPQRAAADEYAQHDWPALAAPGAAPGLGSLTISGLRSYLQVRACVCVCVCVLRVGWWWPARAARAHVTYGACCAGTRMPCRARAQASQHVSALSFCHLPHHLHTHTHTRAHTHAPTHPRAHASTPPHALTQYHGLKLTGTKGALIQRIQEHAASLAT